ncbi:Presequence translocated-associated motor subunit pam17, mitochondrial [Taphrina deformans PYCC 5710]|uniref:Presequence translocated-associated motor subunit PAM17 n=1 Tax=Taphrina deformans (strain PYCC 5710 / ATCC 11124 / CBS 356.35 / IMI 108563 / JCM 9778 / NBRC 8474) TaxID=1097556 RepID=R4X6M0_TAPDE|nr:Presequence translocated-associated motor subunit pam17, mitochondrial [Taphrina deformans PYCC 5710]|eukprot:CCG80826.1 Presequence translocated-associated motor subunit pam17, mitochondrial [Taphrina deformans PYCC 5710]
MLTRCRPAKSLAQLPIKPPGCRSITQSLSDNPSDTEVRNIAPTEKLPWNDFLHLRRQRHHAELIASVPSALLGLFGGLSYFATLEIDPSQLVLGVDPLILYGGATVACGGLGWLVGPVFGSTAWKIVHRKKAQLIEAREKEFYEHVKKNRVDPSRQSFNNPVPDHYAEKIGSVADYRRWLKDCRAYNKKANFGGSAGDLK